MIQCDDTRAGIVIENAIFPERVVLLQVCFSSTCTIGMSRYNLAETGHAYRNTHAQN